MADTEVTIPPQPAAKALSCPSCGGTVTVRAAGYTVSVACQYCGSILDVTNPQVRLITEYKQAAEELEIPLGTRGTIDGSEWEAIGYTQRSMRGEYPWEEYLLFNPYRGYRWLVKSRGGWSLGELQVSTPGTQYGDMVMDGERFAPFFNDDIAQVDYVLGEFYWRVSVGERVRAADWVRPGWMLSREENDSEVAWTLSRLLTAKEIAAFGVSPERWIWPPLPHQPSPYLPLLKNGAKIGGAIAVVMLLLMLVFGGETWTAAGSFPVQSGGVEKTATLGPLTFNRPYQRVEIRADVPALENGWVDLDYALVNRATQERYEAYGAAERYSGSDSDGPWTEGSRGAGVSISSVPAGSYDLEVDYKGNDWNSGSANNSFFGTPSSWMDSGNDPQVKVEVRQGALYPSNFLIAIIALFAPLLLAIFGHLRFENARQNESDMGATGFAALLNSNSEDDDE